MEPPAEAAWKPERNICLVPERGNPIIQNGNVIDIVAIPAAVCAENSGGIWQKERENWIKLKLIINYYNYVY